MPVFFQNLSFSYLCLTFLKTMKKAEKERKAGLQTMFEPILVVLVVQRFHLLVFLASPREEVYAFDRLSLLLEREPLFTCTVLYNPFLFTVSEDGQRTSSNEPEQHNKQCNVLPRIWHERFWKEHSKETCHVSVMKSMSLGMNHALAITIDAFVILFLVVSRLF